MQIIVILIFFLLGYNYFIEISNKEKNNIVSTIEIKDELIFGMQKIENINYFIRAQEQEENSILNRPEVKKIVSNILKRSKLEDIVLLNDIVILKKIEQNIKSNDQDKNVKSDNTNNLNLKNHNQNSKNNLNNIKSIEDHISDSINEMTKDIKVEKNLLKKYNPSNNEQINLNSSHKIDNYNNQSSQINNIDDIFILKIDKNNASQKLVGHSINQNIKINNQIFNIVNIIKPFKYDHVRYFLINTKKDKQINDISSNKNIISGSKNQQLQNNNSIQNANQDIENSIIQNNQRYKITITNLKTNSIISQESINSNSNFNNKPIILDFLLSFVNENTKILAILDTKLLEIYNSDDNLNKLVQFYYKIYNSKFDFNNLIKIEIESIKQ